MKKIIVLLSLALILIAGPSFARNPLLDGVYVTGAGDGYKVTERQSKHTVEIFYVDANASISALTVALQGTDDGPEVTDANAHWFSLASHIFTAPEITAKQAMFHVYEAAVARVRLNITTITGATSADEVTGLYNQGR